MNTAKFEDWRNFAQAILISVKSDYTFVHQSQVIDNPKERDCK